jgi:hypothetical protein
MRSAHALTRKAVSELLVEEIICILNVFYL